MGIGVVAGGGKAKPPASPRRFTDTFNMAEFSIGQRNAFAKILEDMKDKVKYMSRLDGYEARETERREIGAKFGLRPAPKDAGDKPGNSRVV